MRACANDAIHRIDTDLDVDTRSSETTGDRSKLAQLDDNTTGTSIRASKLFGLNIRNRAGKDIGEVSDIVMDPVTGKIRYAALSFGGFLGLGDKLFAIPWTAFDAQRDPNDDDGEDYYLVLNVDENSLKNAPGFDQERWPDFADRTFTTQVDVYYRNRIRTRTTEPGSRSSTTPGTTTTPGPNPLRSAGSGNSLQTNTDTSGTGRSSTPSSRTRSGSSDNSGSSNE